VKARERQRESINLVIKQRWPENPDRPRAGGGGVERERERERCEQEPDVDLRVHERW